MTSMNGAKQACGCEAVAGGCDLSGSSAGGTSSSASWVTSAMAAHRDHLGLCGQL